MMMMIDDDDEVDNDDDDDDDDDGMVCNVTCKVASASVPTFPPASSQFTPRSSSTLPGVLFFFFLLRTQAEFFTYIPFSASSQFTLMPSSSPWAVHENTSPYLLCNIILGFRRACNGIGRALGSAQWAQSRRRPYFFLAVT